MDTHSALTRITSLVSFFIYASVSYKVLDRVNDIVPDPYMDEIFHVPQAQHYCSGEFGVWDPKLTTPPGLYLLSIAYPTLLRYFIGTDSVINICSTKFLRTTNWVLGLLLFWAIYGIVRRLRPVASVATVSLLPLTLSLFPILFFLDHLYYTDTGSLLFVLVSYSLSLSKCHRLAALSGLVSLLFRQTNVIWVAFIGFSAALDELHARKIVDPSSTLKGSLAQIFGWMSRLDSSVLDLIVLIVPYTLVFILFAIFLYVNQGIVLGDKSHHKAVMHIPQLFYFVSYFVGISAPAILPRASPLRFLRAIMKRPVHFVLLLLLFFIVVIVVKKYTIEHPFLLSDNRHYPFYIWKNIYRRHWAARYAVIPGYLYAAWAIWSFSLRSKPMIWQIALFVCTAAVLAPSPLLEFRYFTTPYFFFRLSAIQSSSTKIKALIGELLWFIIINTVTIWVFLNKPFAWDSEPGKLQRFMW